MDLITIKDLEVRYCVGVSDEERANPQRLLLTLEISHDVSQAADKDDVWWTIDYFQVSRRLLKAGQGRSWHLIETVAVDLADLVLKEFGAGSVTVEVKKFILNEAAYVSVRIARSATT
ncbi:MAG: dihydroneopterin aldolase [Verrucomicrobia bacterium]|nr:dihydroneopterin aldolase [Verrucomicrobiota bacterium]